jgi:hypothetical protein
MGQPMYAQVREGLDLLSAKLRRIQIHYEWARTRGDSDRINQFQMQLNAISTERDRLTTQGSSASEASNELLTTANSQVEGQGASGSTSVRPAREADVRRSSMITGAEPKPFFLSVDPKDGSMEAFDEIKDAVAHATDLVKDQETERLIYVAIPQARVRMAVRVEPITAPSLPAAELSEPPAPAATWEESQSLENGLNGHGKASLKHGRAM